MDHGVAHFYTGGEAIDEDTAAPALQHRQQGAGAVVVALLQVQAGGELAFQVLGDLQQLLHTAGFDDDGGRAKHL